MDFLRLWIALDESWSLPVGQVEKLWELKEQSERFYKVSWSRYMSRRKCRELMQLQKWMLEKKEAYLAI